MGARGYEHGSAPLGVLFLVSVFGPMALLAAIWALAAGVGQNGPVRDLAGEAMVWVLLVSGVVLTIEEAVLFFATLLGRSRVKWPARRPGPPAA
ncbi:MAG: hypothetical protein K1X35_06120 [Caulobacteraceae bacterium]|nr:hypothetical protein [Caulobacteraceae bacterium]